MKIKVNDLTRLIGKIDFYEQKQMNILREMEDKGETTHLQTDVEIEELLEFLNKVHEFIEQVEVKI